MKKVIVTGGLGFIGSNLVNILIKKKYFVINIDKVTYSSNFYNVRNLLKNKIADAKLIVDDEQQQLRFRPRPTNSLPFLGKLGRWVIPTRSFLQRDEYFKGTPIFVVQVQQEERNIVTEQYFNLIGKFDSAWGRIIEFYDQAVGFGHNWIMQGSLKADAKPEKYTNYVFLNESDARDFVKKQGRKVTRYRGSRTSNVEFMVRKPKIFVYNLEDFLECWEEKLLSNLKNKNLESLLETKDTFFIPSKGIVEELLDEPINQANYLQNFKQGLGLKYRLLKNYIGFLFSVGYA